MNNLNDNITFNDDFVDPFVATYYYHDNGSLHKIVFDNLGLVTFSTWSDVDDSKPVSYYDSDSAKFTIDDSGMINYQSGQGEIQQQPQIIYKEANMFTVPNILGIALIALITYKISQKLTIFNCFRWFIRLVIKPFKRSEKKIKKEWYMAERAERERRND